LRISSNERPPVGNKPESTASGGKEVVAGEGEEEEEEEEEEAIRAK
jgi:hypothetical protein